MGRNEINIKDCQQRKKGSQKQSPKGMFKWQEEMELQGTPVVDKNALFSKFPMKLNFWYP
jgi:hypothetical protein